MLAVTTPLTPLPTSPPATLHRYSFARMNLVAYLAVTGLVLGTILKMTHGHFSYGLDDPYIHLALAERLRHGFYGLNAGEPSSPSSSVLWPFLLVPFVGTPLLAWAPLLLNILFSSMTAWLLGMFVQRTFLPDWRGRTLSLLLLAGTNVFGLAFTGLEHPLEVLLGVVGALAVLHVLDGTRVPAWSILAVALLPSIRYEGVLITLAVACSLWVARSRRTAIGLVIASMLPPAAFSLYLHRMGLPWFPISVLVKSSSTFQEHRGLVIRVAHILYAAAKQTLLTPERAPQTLIVIALIWFAVHQVQTRVRLVLGACALVGLVQVILGPVGWFYRYELYYVTFALIVALHAMRDTISDTPLTGRRLVPGMLLMLMGALGLVYAPAVVSTAQASTAIWQQQAQLGRFSSQFYSGPVAVNDLGWVAFDRRQDQYVLDLVGLGSAEVYRTPEVQRTAAWLDGITREHGAGLVMIYPSWFKALPSTWKPVAKLCNEGSRGQLGPAEPRVMFYETPVADDAALSAALVRFKATLPVGTSLELHPLNASDTCSK